MTSPLDTIEAAIDTAESTLFFVEDLLPTQKLVDHSKWQRAKLKKALAECKKLREMFVSDLRAVTILNNFVEGE